MLNKISKASVADEKEKKKVLRNWTITARGFHKDKTRKRAIEIQGLHWTLAHTGYPDCGTVGVGVRLLKT